MAFSQDAILKYNAHYSKRWNFEALHSYFNEVRSHVKGLKNLVKIVLFA